MVMRYGPGTTPGKTYSPASLVLVVRLTFVAVLVRVITAEGATADDWSWATPRTVLTPACGQAVSRVSRKESQRRNSGSFCIVFMNYQERGPASRAPRWCAPRWCAAAALCAIRCRSQFEIATDCPAQPSGARQSQARPL